MNRIEKNRVHTLQASDNDGIFFERDLSLNAKASIHRRGGSCFF